MEGTCIAWTGFVFRSSGTEGDVATELFLSDDAVKGSVERLRSQHHRAVRNGTAIFCSCAHLPRLKSVIKFAVFDQRDQIFL